MSGDIQNFTRLDNLIDELSFLHDELKKVQNREQTLTDVARKINTTPQRLNDALSGRNSLFRALKFDVFDFEELVKESTHPSERLLVDLYQFKRPLSISLEQMKAIDTLIEEYAPSFLTQEQYFIICNHYGFGGYKPSSISEIARKQDVTRQTAHRSFTAALSRIHQHISSREMHHILQTPDVHPLKALNEMRELERKLEIAEKEIANLNQRVRLTQAHLNQNIPDVNKALTRTTLSTRAINACHRNGLYTISDLLRVSEEHLYHFKNVGRKTLTELIELRTPYLIQQTGENYDN